jgi:hypothetical protein
MRAPRPLLYLSSIALISLVGSCSSSVRAPAKAPDAYRGPPLALESTPPQHRVILTAPTGGWTFELDQTRRAFDHTDVFLTLVEPDPAYMHPQSQVRQEAGTGIEPAERIEVFARVLPHGAKPAKQAYNPVPFAWRTP